MILLTCAVRKELSFFRAVPHVEMLVTGVGPIEASAAVSRALAQSPYDLVVNAGIGGAFAGAAQVGDGVAVAEDYMEIGLETGDSLALPEGVPLIERASSDFNLVERLMERGVAAKRGITVSRVTATEATARRLASLGAQVESMEGFAVLRAAEIAAVPAIEIRGISNIVTERTQSGWNFAAGVSGLENVLTSLLSVVSGLYE